MALTDEEEAELRAELAALREGPSTGGADPETVVVVEAPPPPNVEVIAAEAEAAATIIAAQASADVKVIEAQTEQTTAIVEAEVEAHRDDDDGSLLSPDSTHWYFTRKKRRDR